MTGEITVRPVRPVELDLLTDMVMQMWAAHTHENDDIDITDRNAATRRAKVLMTGSAVLMFGRGRQIIGYAALQDQGDYMFIRHFLIDAAHRGNGTGRAAYNALAEACFPGRPVRLDVSMHVAEPRAFWEALGFFARGIAMQRDAEAA